MKRFLMYAMAAVISWDSDRPARTSDRRSTVKHHTESSSSSNCRNALFLLETFLPFQMDEMDD